MVSTQGPSFNRDEIRITTFGKLLVERGGAAVADFVSTKAALLFVYLAMHPGEHSRKKLAALLWSETSDEQALKNLRTVLSSVRQQVGEALIVSHEDLAVRDHPPVQVDASQFENGFRKVFSTPGTLTLLKALQELEALYQGEFLASVVVRDAVPLEDWIDERRRQLDELYGRLLLEIVEIALKQGSYEVGLDYAWKLVSHDPLLDTAQRHLMRLLAYTDRANDALVQYERFAALLREELDAEPEAETTTLCEQIRARAIAPPRASGLFARVQPDVDFVEPADDIELAQRMLNTPNCRLLTLYGISGIGKTMLATQLAYHRQHLYRDGASFVSLVMAQTPRDLLEAVARALEVSFTSTMTEAALERAVVDALKPRHLLLVLDNYEQLLPETGFIQRVLLEAPSVQVVVTSQTQLNLFREWLLPLKGLRVPEVGAENSQAYEAVRLFELTARRVNPRFDLSASLDDVIRICRMVDSLPLGIVIAAGWVQFMPPAAILKMMQADLLRMEAVHQDMPARHQSFQGLLNAMLAHLTPPEQEALMALSVFEGTFDFKAALAVAGVSPRAFKGLTDRCLVQQAGDFRYCIHSFVRQAFFPQLEHSPLLRTVATRYVDHFQGWADDFFAQNLPLHDLMLALDAEAHNLWQIPGLTALERQRFLMAIAPAMTEYWVNRGYHARGIIPLLQAGSASPEIEPAVRVRGLVALARILERTSQYDAAREAAEGVLRLEDGLNLPEARARALRVLSEICARQGLYDRAVEYLQAIIAMESQPTAGRDIRVERLVSLAYEDLGRSWSRWGSTTPPGSTSMWPSAAGASAARPFARRWRGAIWASSR
ncbi:MAG: AAA family ATPase [Chloroflexi bacterium]|nr:AAA family ATPase [Chloroflexota bacterium]